MRGLKLATVLILYAWHVAAVSGARSGPFKSSPMRVEPCSNPTMPMDSDPAASFFAELHNTTTEFNIIRGKVTIFRDYRIRKLKVKSYLWDNNKWKVSYMMNNMGCNRVFFPMLVKATGVKYDPKTCTLYKGEYVFKNLNIDMVQHLIMKSQEYGRVLWNIELFSYTGTVFCWNIQTLTVPA